VGTVMNDREPASLWVFVMMSSKSALNVPVFLWM
jgi:hypothetical protein